MGKKDPSMRLLYPSLTGVRAWDSTSIAIPIEKEATLSIGNTLKCKEDLIVNATFQQSEKQMPVNQTVM